MSVRDLIRKELAQSINDCPHGSAHMQAMCDICDEAKMLRVADAAVKAAVEAERETCAQLCDREAPQQALNRHGNAGAKQRASMASWLATRIRARATNKPTTSNEGEK